MLAFIQNLKKSVPTKHAHFWLNLVGPYDSHFYCASFPPVRFTGCGRPLQELNLKILNDRKHT